MKIEVLYFDGCPNYKPAIERIQQVLAEEGLSAEVREVSVTGQSMARRVGFRGSPSIRVNGRDVEPEPAMAMAGAHGMMCRTYVVNGRMQGLPSRDMLRQAMRDANPGEC